MRQVLINLLGNAIKFTEAGQVILQVKTCEELTLLKSTSLPQACGSPDDDRPCLNFIIKDTGSGIAPNDLNKLFKPFSQTESGLRSGEGTGLGLPISRKFVELMGGTLTVNSVVDQGSSFHFHIRYRRPDSLPSETNDRLLLDDTADSLHTIKFPATPPKILASF